MSEVPITVTEAARNFAECVNRAHYQQQTFVLLKNGMPVARLGPANVPTGKGSELANALRDVRLTPAEAQSWGRDMEAARKTLLPPSAKWPSS